MGRGATATHYTNVDTSLAYLFKINGHYQNGNKAFYHGNSRFHLTGTLMNYDLGSFIVKRGADFGRDSVQISQMANFITSSSGINKLEKM